MKTYKKILVVVIGLFSLIACKKTKNNTNSISNSPYSGGVLFLSYTDSTGLGRAEISFLDKEKKLFKNIFAKNNADFELSPGANSLYYFDNKYYITSNYGPADISVLNANDLKLAYAINQSDINRVTYFATNDGKTGYVNIANRRKFGLYAVNLTDKSIALNPISGTENTPLLPIQTANKQIVISVGKQLLKIVESKSSLLNTFQGNISGIIQVGNELWVGIQGTTTQKAKFIKLNQDFNGVDSVELDANVKLPVNGILTANRNDAYIYWQETSKATLNQFNIRTKEVKELINFANEGIIFATCWKIDPNSGLIYIADSPGLFTAESPASDVYIFDNNGQRKNYLKNVGYQITDIAFPN